MRKEMITANFARKLRDISLSIDEQIKTAAREGKSQIIYDFFTKKTEKEIIKICSLYEDFGFDITYESYNPFGSDFDFPEHSNTAFKLYISWDQNSEDN